MARPTDLDQSQGRAATKWAVYKPALQSLSTVLSPYRQAGSRILVGSQILGLSAFRAVLEPYPATKKYVLIQYNCRIGATIRRNRQVLLWRAAFCVNTESRRGIQAKLCSLKVRSSRHFIVVVDVKHTMRHQKLCLLESSAEPTVHDNIAE